MPIEDMENITFNQTFYYWNWNGPIREPAALKFAEVCSQFNAKVKMDNVPDEFKKILNFIMENYNQKSQ